MDIKIKTWLLDIQNATEEIESFLPPVLSFSIFNSDLKTRKAVERNIEIIGEAINRIIKLDATINIQNAHKIKGTRNRLAHEYDKISVEIIWAIVIKELPLLKKEVDTLLNQIIK